METWKNYGEHALRLIQGVDNWQTIGMVAMFCLLIGVASWYNSPWYVERAVSKRRIKARHRKVKDIAAQKITEALEQSHVIGELKRNEVDYIYTLIREAGLKEVGPEPSFGRPWYYGPANVVPDFPKLKREVLNRLHQMQVDVTQKLGRLKRSKPLKKKDMVLAVLQSKKSTHA